MHRALSRPGEPWSLRDGSSTVHILRRRDVPEQEARREVALALMPWKLERWMRSSPDTLRSIYEALGGTWPWGLTSLERLAHEQRVVSRLAEAFESGTLAALVEEPPRIVDPLPEDEEPAKEDPGYWLPPSARAAPPAPAGPALDAAAQAETLRKAARDGVPFCEECQKRKQQRAAA